jgi:endonuclease/exonuclease/phosphatase (EEP) superfamily protein YafD
VAILSLLANNHGVKAILFGTAVLTALATLAGFAGRFWWLLDLTSHFRVQYFFVLLFLSLIILLLRNPHFAIFCVVFAILNLSLVLPLYMAAPSSLNPHIRPMRAMMMNVSTENTNHSAVIASIARYDPDFLLLEEVDARWMNALKPLDHSYPHSISRPRGDNFGIAFYSKQPLAHSEVINMGQAGLPTVLVQVEVWDRKLFILGTHSLPPVNAAYARLRDNHLAEISDMLNTIDAPVLLLGDLNATPWSYPFRRLLRESGLRDGSQGMGYQPTWPAGFFPLFIPIDHCLYSEGLTVIKEEVGPPVGSDHYPVIVDFVATGRGRARAPQAVSTIDADR